MTALVRQLSRLFRRVPPPLRGKGLMMLAAMLSMTMAAIAKEAVRDGQPMDVTAGRDGEVLFAGVTERIDGSAAAAFENSLRDAIAEGDLATIVDFGGCPYVGSAGLRVVRTITTFLRGRDAELALCGLSEPIREAFRIGGFDGFVPTDDTRADAPVALGV